MPSFLAAVTVAIQRLDGIELRDFIARAWLSSTPIASAKVECLPNAAMTSEKEFMALSLPDVATQVNTARGDFVATMRSHD